jgi:hypothetical protein
MLIQVEFEDYVSGTKFQELADNLDVYYCHTHDFDKMAYYILHTPKNVVLITHNSDGKVTKNPNENDANVTMMPENVVKWFGCNIIDHNDRTVSIPTGLENAHHFREIDKQRRIFEKNSEGKKIRNLCYMNFNVNTNPTERGGLYNKFEGKEWVTTKRGSNGQDFHGYLDDIYNHDFVLCPEGNSNGHPVSGGGVASHRVWECLYANTTPILTRGSQSEQFYDLPIVFVDSWDEVTEGFLIRKYYEFRDSTKIKTFNIDKLKMSYWKEQIWGK